MAAEKYHISEDGNPRPCEAQPGRCKYGADTTHYVSMEAAREAYEASMESYSNEGFSKKIKDAGYKPSIKEKLQAAANKREKYAILLEPANGYITQKELDTYGREQAAVIAKRRIRKDFS